MQDSEGVTYREWAHSPSHLFIPNAGYIVTAGTYQRALLFDAADKLDFLLSTLFEEALRFGWQLQAWAVMANHYHFVAQAPENVETLKALITVLHSRTAAWLNEKDNTPGRKVWFQYWDTCLTFEKSYLARLNYVHHNPVRHRLVENAEQYRWCSLSWFMQKADPGFRRTVLSFKYDRVNVKDDF